MLNRILTVILLILCLTFLAGWFGGWKHYIQTGTEAYQYGNYDEAFNAFQQAVIERPNNPITHHNLGTVLYKQGKYRMAIAAFQTSLSKGNAPNTAAVYYNLGNAQLQMNDLEGAIQSYRFSLRLNPQDVDTEHNLSIALQLLKELQDKIVHQQNNASVKKDLSQSEPKRISKSETQKLLDHLSKNENKRRQQILTQQFDDGIRRDKDW